MVSVIVVVAVVVVVVVVVVLHHKRQPVNDKPVYNVVVLWSATRKIGRITCEGGEVT